MVAAVKRTDGIKAQMHETLRTWSQRPTAEALMSLRGVSTITAMTILAELGDLTRFDSPRQLVSFLGLAPWGTLLGLSAAPGGDHQDRQRSRLPGADRGGMGLSLSGQKDCSPAPQGSQCSGPGPSDVLGGPETAVRSICEALPARQGQEQGDHGNRPRARGLHLGHCLRGAG